MAAKNKPAAKKAAAAPKSQTPDTPPPANPDAHPNAAEVQAAAAAEAAEAAQKAEQAEREAQAAAAAVADEAAKAAAVHRSTESDEPVGSAAWRRADDLRALEEERDACKAAKKDDRVKEIESQIKRLKSLPIGRTAPKRGQA